MYRKRYPCFGNYVKDHYSVANIIKKDTKMNSVKIKNGQTNKVDVITEKDIEAVLPNNYLKQGYRLRYNDYSHHYF